MRSANWLVCKCLRLACFLLPSSLIFHPSSVPLQAAEIHLKSECNASGLVRLGDVAEIHAHDAAEAQQLKEMELFPAPAVGNKTFVRAREVQDLLALRGINLSQHRLTGSSQIEIHNGAKSATPLSASATRRAAERVEAAIAACLRRQAGKEEAWEIEVDLEEEQVRIVAACKDSIKASGGQSPWTGDQQFTIALPGTSSEQRLTVPAKVTAVPLVVVATRAMVPGDIVQRTDVKLGQGKNDTTDLPFHSVDEVVGQETKRAIVEGQALKQGDLRSPLLVRRGDAVHVFARSAGIQVRTEARAQEEGSRGDLIVVESILTRERFMARVSGIHEVEVFAQTADADAAAGTPGSDTRPLKAAHPKATATAQTPGFRLPSRTAAAPLPERPRTPTVQR